MSDSIKNDPGSATPRFNYDTGKRDTPAIAERVARDEVEFPALFWVLVIGFIVFFGYFFSQNVEGLTGVWYRDASWSHGFVVPLIAAFFVHLNWDRLIKLKARPSWVGGVLVLYAAVSQVFFRITGQEHMSNLTILVMLIGAILLVLGWAFLRILWLPVIYLVFMIPPPSTLYVKLTTPMQHWAATLGVSLMKILGITAYQSGTTLYVETANGWSQLSVEEACSGIRMLLAFFALAVALAYTSNRPMWQKVFLSLCAAPVAIFCNSLRVGLTGMLFVRAGPEFARGTAHEMLGFAMLIPAMAMQLGLAWLLDKIFIEDDDASEQEAAS